jgi:hypothetical protein
LVLETQEEDDDDDDQCRTLQLFRRPHNSTLIFYAGLFIGIMTWELVAWHQSKKYTTNDHLEGDIEKREAHAVVQIWYMKIFDLPIFSVQGSLWILILFDLIPTQKASICFPKMASVVLILPLPFQITLFKLKQQSSTIRSQQLTRKRTGKPRP